MEEGVEKVEETERVDEIEEVETKKTLREYMYEQKLVDRWLVMKVGLAGMFAGVVLSTIYYLAFIL